MTQDIPPLAPSRTLISRCKMHAVHLQESRSLDSSTIAQKPKSKVSSETRGKLLAVNPQIQSKLLTHRHSHSKRKE